MIRILNKYNGEEIINTSKGTLWVNEKLKLTHETYKQPSLSESNNYS